MRSRWVARLAAVILLLTMGPISSPAAPDQREWEPGIRAQVVEQVNWLSGRDLPQIEQSNPPRDGQVVELASSLVMLNVSVMDSHGRHVPNLVKSDFTVFEDGAVQDITHFEHGDAPASVVLVMDQSASMYGPPLAEAQRAASGFIELCHPRSEIALIAFNGQVQTLQEFTGDRTQIKSAVDRLTASGGTALYDALARAVAMMDGALHPRHIIVLMTDGEDKDSRQTFEEAELMVQSSDVVVFATGQFANLNRKSIMSGRKFYREPGLPRRLNPVWVLNQFVDGSGGKAFFPEVGTSLEVIFSSIAHELQNQYVLGYVPPDHAKRSGLHTIEVKVKKQRRKEKITVRTRRLYLEDGR